MRNKNVKPKIGTGTLIDPDVYKLAEIRTCGRELVGADTYPPDRRCSMPCKEFEAACRYHITDAEKDAALLARIAYRMGVKRGRVTTDDDPDFPDPSKSRRRWKLTPEEQADQDAVREAMKNFRI